MTFIPNLARLVQAVFIYIGDSYKQMVGKNENI